MKVYGLFRGFPGLGRVVSGVEILRKLRDDYNFDVRIFTYMQGIDVASKYNFNIDINRPILNESLTSIGINPVSILGSEIISEIVDWNPDIVIIDGEPLMTKALSLCFPKQKIISLLNPYDIDNPNLPIGSQLYFRDCFLSSGISIIHGLDNKKLPCSYQNNKIYSINTILREEILNLKNDRKKHYISKKENKQIVCILGGGTKNCSSDFLETTLEIGRKVIEIASFYPKYMFNIYTNDDNITNSLSKENINNNVLIHNKFNLPKDIYLKSDLVICRAGRNTTSELLYMGIPSILIATGKDFRSKEQEANINKVCKLSNGLIKKLRYTDTINNYIDTINKLLDIDDIEVDFIPGNKEIKDIIDDYIYNIKLNKFKDNIGK